MLHPPSARDADLLPLIEPLPIACTAEEAFQRLAERPYCIFFDSARPSGGLGRYSFVAVDPFEVIRADVGDGEIWSHLDDRLRQFPAETLPGDSPPFQGGAAGFWSYELLHGLERVDRARFDPGHVPALCVGLYDLLLAFDRETEIGWVISQGFPELETENRRRRARERRDQLLAWLTHPTAADRGDRSSDGSSDTSSDPTSDTSSDRSQWASRPTDETSRRWPSNFAPQFETPHAGVFSDFSAAAYQAAVQQAIDYVHAGDIFQVNLSQHLVARATVDPAEIYLSMRRRNAAPFAGFFNAGTHQIVSASPERFLKIRDRQVETRPIKGTRRRTSRPEADLFAGAELQSSAKDLSENTMIVDLLRNDLSRVCEDDSVVVSKWCGLESYELVQHLVSVVEGRLRPDATPIDCIRACFPGGSITGAPKVRAMEIISELEPTARGAYCGSLGYVGFDGSADLSILIRTLTCYDGWWHFPVGGGIVANSDPKSEYEETWIKAAGMLRGMETQTAQDGK